MKLIVGPKSDIEQWFSTSHLNLNRITAHSYAEVSLLTTCNPVNKFDIICSSETYLTTETLPNDTNLEMLGCDKFCCDYHSNYKKEILHDYSKATLSL